MKKILCLLFAPLLLIACGSKPVPTWIGAGHQQLETYKKDFLTGRPSLITEQRFKKATEEIKKGGDIDLLGRAWLTRMALQVAVLEEIDEGEYGTVEAALPVPANRNFYLFLTGNLTAVDATLLHVQYRPFLTALRNGNVVETGETMAKIDDPLSLLIAAGLTVRRNLENETSLRTAVETASQNGWKRALLAWLRRLQAFYDRAGDGFNAARVRQRIEIIGK